MTLTVPTWTLADRLRKARLHAGLDQRALAAALGLSHASVAHYELGRRRPSRVTVARWALACGVSVDWLLGPGPAEPGASTMWLMPRAAA